MGSAHFCGVWFGVFATFVPGVGGQWRADTEICVCVVF